METNKHSNVDENREEEMGFRDRVKIFWSKHKKAILGTASVTVLLGLIAFLIKNGSGSDEKNDTLEDVYDILLQKREEIRMNPQSKSWESDLARIDKQLSSIPNPRREYSKTLSDDELESHIQSARSVWDSAKEAFEKKTKGMSYEDYYKDPEKIQLDKLHDIFYQSVLEKEHRYAEANPGKFPIHREHGRYLPNDD